MTASLPLSRALCWICISIACAVSAAAIGAQSPDQPARAATAVMVTGEFRADGSCQVYADSVPVFRPADSAETTYIRGATFNIAPSGFDAHEVWCAPRSPERPMPPLTPSDRALVVMLYAPTGQLATPRSYEIIVGLPTPETAPYRAGAALFGMSPQMLNDTMPLRLGLMYLAGSRGTVAIMHVNADRIVGTFNIGAQRALTM